HHLQLQRLGIDTIPQPAGLRTVGKHMPQMRVADTALEFDPRHPEGCILDVGDHIILDGLCKARPARTRIELDAGIEKLGVAANTFIFSRFVTAAKLAAESRLSPLFP